MRIDISDLFVRTNPSSIIGQQPVQNLVHPVIINRDGENTGLHELRELLRWMGAHSPPTGPITRKTITFCDIEPVLLTDHSRTLDSADGGSAIRCRYFETLNILLMCAVESDHHARAAYLIDMRADPTMLLVPTCEHHFNAITPLHSACSRHGVDMVTAMLKAAHANFLAGGGGAADASAMMKHWLDDTRSPRGNTALHLTIMGCSTMTTTAFFPAQQPAFGAKGGAGLTKADAAGNIIALLLEHKANPNIVNEDGDTPLSLVLRSDMHHRYCAGQPHGGDRSPPAFTYAAPPFVTAAAYHRHRLQQQQQPSAPPAPGQAQVLTVDLQDVREPNSPHYTPSGTQAQRPSPNPWLDEVVRLLLRAKANAGPVSSPPCHFSKPPLRIAIENGCSTGVVAQLLRAQASPSGISYRGQPSCLMAAASLAQNAHIRLLVQHKASVLHSDMSGNTAWHYAAKQNHASTIRLLRKLFPDAALDDDNNDGHTPMHTAVLHCANAAAAALLCPPALLSTRPPFSFSATASTSSDPPRLALSPTDSAQAIEGAAEQQRRRFRSVFHRDDHVDSDDDGDAKDRLRYDQLPLIEHTDGNIGFTPVHHAVAMGNLPLLNIMLNAAKAEDRLERAALSSAEGMQAKRERPAAFSGDGSDSDNDNHGEAGVQPSPPQDADASGPTFHYDAIADSICTTRTRDGLTSLHLAALNGRENVVRFLLSDLYASVDAPNDDRYTFDDEDEEDHQATAGDAGDLLPNRTSFCAVAPGITIPLQSQSSALYFMVTGCAITPASAHARGDRSEAGTAARITTRAMSALRAQPPPSAPATKKRARGASLADFHDIAASLLPNATICMRIAQILLVHGADPNLYHASKGEAPLHSFLQAQVTQRERCCLVAASAADNDDDAPQKRKKANRHDTTDAEDAIDSADEDAVDACFMAQALLVHGAKVNALTRGHERQYTPLHIAMTEYAAEPFTLRVLLASGADPSIADPRKRRTPLHLAAGNPFAMPYISTLLDAVPDPQKRAALLTQPDAAGHTPLDLAIEQERILAQRARPSSHDSVGKILLCATGDPFSYDVGHVLSLASVTLLSQLLHRARVTVTRIKALIAKAPQEPPSPRHRRDCDASP